MSSRCFSIRYAYIKKLELFKLVDGFVLLLSLSMLVKKMTANMIGSEESITTLHSCQMLVYFVLVSIFSPPNAWKNRHDKVTIRLFAGSLWLGCTPNGSRNLWLKVNERTRFWFCLFIDGIAISIKMIYVWLGARVVSSCLRGSLWETTIEEQNILNPLIS